MVRKRAMDKIDIDIHIDFRHTILQVSGVVIQTGRDEMIDLLTTTTIDHTTSNHIRTPKNRMAIPPSNLVINQAEIQSLLLGSPSE